METKRIVRNAILIILCAITLCFTVWAASQPTRVHVYSISQPAGIR